MDAVRRLILEKLEEKGLTMSEASLKIGRNHAYLQQFLKRGIPAMLGEIERERLADLLGVPENALRGTSPPLPKREYVKLGGTVAEIQPNIKLLESGQTRVDNHREVTTHIGERDLPVFGTAQGGSGALIVTDLAVDYVVRPEPLLKVRDGYGMIVAGDSMSPKIENGDTVLVNPYIPPREGATCVFRYRKDDGTLLAVIRKLRRFNDEFWFVTQMNPEKDYTLRRSEWQFCHAIVSINFGR